MKSTFPFWHQFKRWMNAQFQQIKNRHIFALAIGYIAFGYLLLSLAQETQLTKNPQDYIYYLLVTASTVGYGDMSPETPLGKWIVALFIIPCGLSLFAVAVGRIAAMTVNFWRSGLLGKRHLMIKEHILILGWHGNRTLHLIDMLLHEERNKRPIVLCVRREMENPQPKDIDFVTTPSFTDPQAMVRSGVNTASCIIIDNPDDDITFAAALFCASQNPKAHILAYFNDEVLSRLLKSHCPNAECVPSLAVEMLAKSAVDPGSSAIHHELINSKKGMTQYTTTYPENQPEIQVNAVFLHLKARFQATLIGLETAEGIILNPDLNHWIYPGSILYYIADERVEHFDWQVSNQ